MNDIVFVLTFFLGLIIFVTGLSLLFGLGWALVIIDLITGSSSGTNYFESQSSMPATKKKKIRILGSILTIVGFSIIIFILNQ